MDPMALPMNQSIPVERAAAHGSAEAFASQLAKINLNMTPEEARDREDWIHAHDAVWKGMEIVRWSGLGAAMILGVLVVFESSVQARNAFLVVALFFFLLFLSLSARNLRPACLADRFVPARVPWFRRWLLSQPSVHYADLIRAEIGMSETKRPLELVLVTASGASYRFSLRKADVFERTIASQIMDRILQFGVPFQLETKPGIP